MDRYLDLLKDEFICVFMAQKWKLMGIPAIKKYIYYDNIKEFGSFDLKCGTLYSQKFSSKIKSKIKPQ